MSLALAILRAPRPSRVSAYLASRLGRPVIDPETVRIVLDRYGLALEDTPRNLLSDPVRAARMAVAGRARVSHHLGGRTQTQELVALFESRGRCTSPMGAVPDARDRSGAGARAGVP